MSTQRVLIYGGKGALGDHLVNYFKSKSVYVLSVDLSKHESADENVIVNFKDDWCGQEISVVKDVGSALGNNQLDAILCVAGGWAGGNASSNDFIKNSDLSWKQSVWSSTISAKLATKFLKPGGLLQMTGAAGAINGTPGMLGYGMAKAAVHHLVKSLAFDSKATGLPDGTNVLAILPVTLDTPMNRKWMPKADFSKWTPLSFVASTLYSWTYEIDKRPETGSLIKLNTKNGETELEKIQ